MKSPRWRKMLLKLRTGDPRSERCVTEARQRIFSTRLVSEYPPFLRELLDTVETLPMLKDSLSRLLEGRLRRRERRWFDIAQ